MNKLSNPTKQNVTVNINTAVIKFGLIIMTLVLCLGVFSNTIIAAEKPKISSISNNGNLVKLSGEFGKTCSKCNILVSYGKGFTYKYKAKRWSGNQIQFKIEDLGRSLAVKVQVNNQSGASNKKSFKIPPKLIPRKKSRRAVPKSKIDNTLYYAKTHADKFGNKGTDKFNVSAKLPSCGKTAMVFQRADIVIKKRRFAEAEISAKPKKGCLKCSPVKVRWYNEPTGQIDYQLHVTRRLITGICNNRKK